MAARTFDMSKRDATLTGDATLAYLKGWHNVLQKYQAGSLTVKRDSKSTRIQVHLIEQREPLDIRISGIQIAHSFNRREIYLNKSELILHDFYYAKMTGNTSGVYIFSISIWTDNEGTKVSAKVNK